MAYPKNCRSSSES
ncbi:hypothetical protein LINPERHAP1_LOCUS7781 [Linum perenne]